MAGKKLCRKKSNVMNYKNLLKAGLLIFSMAFIISCSKDEDDNMDTTAETYNTSVEVTDAPIDNANVEGVFVTITNVKINGKALEGFQTTTVNLLALQNGTTQALGNVNLESGTTSSIVVEVDNDMDDQGEAMGNYIKTTSGEKIAFVVESGEIALTDAAEVAASAENNIVLDFDLRKMIGKDSQGNFQLVSGAELQQSIRAVNEMNAGTIEGNVEDANNTAGTVVVYAYEKGTWADSEANENASGVRFAGAVNSTIVSETNGNYSLHFLEEGDYELHYASYSEDTMAGGMSFQGMVQVEAATGLNLDILGFNVGANSTTTANVVVTGMMQ